MRGLDDGLRCTRDHQMTKTNTVTVSVDGTDIKVSAAFPGMEGIEWATTIDKLPPASIARAIRIGLTNIIRDSWASKAGDAAESRQAAANAIKGIETGTSTNGGGGKRLDNTTKAIRA